MTNTKKYECVIIEAERGNDFQDYMYEDGTPVPFGKQIGVEITQDGETELFLLEGIFFKG
jgi:hypothetical protein